MGQAGDVRIRVGCQFDYDAIGPTPVIWQVRPRLDGAHQLLASLWSVTPFAATRSYLDAFGNVCDRMTLMEGSTTVRYDALVQLPATVDEADLNAAQVPVEELPDDALVFLLASRFCHSDVLNERAWDLFGHAPPGWGRVQAVCDWVHDNLTYQMGSSTPLTTSVDVLGRGAGVCRDYTHVGISFCRALNIPARYISGYLPDIGVDPPGQPMDFCSWFEAYLGDRWWTFDPRNNEPRTGRVVIGRGKDAADVAMATTYGAPILKTMEVWADEVEDGPSEQWAVGGFR